ncbi:type IV pilus modification PilV family protein [Corallococcus terminator]|uniref:Type II secretion system protein n=1 Tax=Corallococcus terminator TaxID=2316733 RepID=A0A3A8J454_9BACT|nr:type II secretion system protein [Corallococcus terminator]RKG90245.1 type II secretion system protein [Corallococcus terminator]
MTSGSRGVTLLEVMATMAVMLLGTAAAMTVVSQTSFSNRRTLTANQAGMLAEQTLESLRAQGCSQEPPCGNMQVWDNQRIIYYQTAGGEPTRTAPAAGTIMRQYEVAIDVDGLPIVGSIEGGAPSLGEPLVTRELIPGQPGNVINVRVSVSWVEPNRTGRQVVVLQTRMSP